MCPLCQHTCWPLVGEQVESPHHDIVTYPIPIHLSPLCFCKQCTHFSEILTMVVACTRPARPSFFTLRTCAPQIPHRCAPGARWRRPCHKTVTRVRLNEPGLCKACFHAQKCSLCVWCLQAADQANAPTAVDTTAGLIFKTGVQGFQKLIS